jgi:hypothetical protein
MNDDAVLQTAWMSEAAANDDNVRSVVDRVLDKDAADRLRERRLRVALVAALVCLVPVLIWAAAHGVAPVVRGAYALMAAGCFAGLVAEWLYLDWSRRALPGPDDTRSQLQKTALMLECQVWLARTGALWTSPVFVGVGLICVWLYRERTVAGAVSLCALDIAAWIGVGMLASRAVAALGRQKRELDEVLADLG